MIFARRVSSLFLNLYMKNPIPSYLLALALLPIASCDKEAESPVLRPTFIKTRLEASPTQEGLVTASVSALNANFYTVEFFDKNSSELITTKDGEASYQFSESGKYQVKSTAYASYEYYIERSDSISVTVSNGNGSGNPGIPDSGYTTPMSYPGYDLVWNDEFNGTSLSANWTAEIGTGSNGWGNNELQYYRAENAEVKDGYLIITARQENFGGRNYTSSRLITQNQQSFKYGRIDIRAAVPYGQGIWPALWMLGDNFNSVGWPGCGEIDIMEMVGGNSRPKGGDDVVHGTVHWDNNGQHAEYSGLRKLSEGKLADEFHVYSIIWDATSITWYLDDVKFHEIDITPAELSEFQQKFFFIFNVAVGGNWPGSPNSSTQFPQKMAVDYVRVFQ